MYICKFLERREHLARLSFRLCRKSVMPAACQVTNYSSATPGLDMCWPKEQGQQ